jgi:hypothetical protein
VAYSDYGAFVYKNGERRRDKEDVGVFDTDEANLPSGARILANILKRRETGGEWPWWKHSQHGVMGDGNIRVACYKQGFPTIYHWKDGEEEPTQIDPEKILGLDYFDYPPTDWEYEGYKFHFESGEPYEASMMEPDGTRWNCEYDYGFGAGFEGDD